MVKINLKSLFLITAQIATFLGFAISPFLGRDAQAEPRDTVPNPASESNSGYTNGYRWVCGGPYVPSRVDYGNRISVGLYKKAFKEGAAAATKEECGEIQAKRNREFESNPFQIAIRHSKVVIK